MIQSQREKLNSYPHERLSIGITQDGEPRRSISIPWEYTSNAYNMRTPDVYLSPDDLAGEEVWAELGRFRINGCYIFCPLEDYGFLNRLTELEDLCIRGGGALRDLRFLRRMPGWFQLHVEDAVLENLDDLFPNGPRKGIHSICVCLSGCTVKDISALTNPDIRLSELVILAPQGSDDRERWKTVRCGKYSYWEYRV